MGQPLRVLIVDDSENDAFLLERALIQGGYDIHTLRVDTKEEMAAALASQHWNLIISDFTMPQFSGPAALETLKSSGQDIPFIIVSGSIGEERAVATLRQGAHDFVLKENLSRLIPAVERELREFEIRQDRAKAWAKVQQQIERLQALRMIDVAITSSFDLRITLEVILDQVISQLSVDAAMMLVFNEETETLECGARRGFRTGALKYSRVKMDFGYAGRAAQTRKMIHVADLRLAPSEFAKSKELAAEDFIAYFAVPLVCKGKIEGVLEVFHRSTLGPESDWLDFLEALAGQAAIALDSASLFDHLQRSAQELHMAYDATLEGWIKALDLRDRETEGHSLRVTEATVRLAREFHFRDQEFVHIRRGALLHDIGKLGIPDAILLKAGPLTEEEWVTMRKHPVYAYEWLSPISYLRPALDIPYGHHEKWDGTGYPRGLKGEDIPLAARLFAVVDVWDALRSDRPYRPAWEKERVLEYVRSQSGSHFDPKVIEVFLKNTGWMK